MGRDRFDQDVIHNLQRRTTELEKQTDFTPFQAQTIDYWHVIGASGETPFQNGWISYSDGTDTNPIPAYWKDGAGCTHMRGLVKSGTMSAAIFTLPIGYRPGKSTPPYDTIVYIPTYSNGAFGIVQISSNGAVSASIGNNIYFSIQAIFRAEL